MDEDTILVKSGRADNRVVLWERDRAHPTGEIYIAGAHEDLGDGTFGDEDLSQPVEVAMTAEVMRKLGQHELVRVERDQPTDADRRAAEMERNTGGAPVTAEQQADLDRQIAEAKAAGRAEALAEQPVGRTNLTRADVERMIAEAREQGRLEAETAAATAAAPDDKK